MEEEQFWEWQYLAWLCGSGVVVQGGYMCTVHCVGIYVQHCQMCILHCYCLQLPFSALYPSLHCAIQYFVFVF